MSSAPTQAEIADALETVRKNWAFMLEQNENLTKLVEILRVSNEDNLSRAIHWKGRFDELLNTSAKALLAANTEVDNLKRQKADAEVIYRERLDAAEAHEHCPGCDYPH